MGRRLASDGANLQALRAFAAVDRSGATPDAEGGTLDDLPKYALA
ncbi:MAG TPA: hypothetical protein VMJ31_06830 [Methylocystis sp.]|nr:hypothetical protein [Methylocystis sp.]